VESDFPLQVRQSAVPLLRNHKRAATLTKLLAPGGNARTVRWKEVEALLEQGLGAQVPPRHPSRPQPGHPTSQVHSLSLSLSSSSG
jgi:hypothetical protein